MPENNETNTWNQQLAEWYKNSGKSMVEIQKQTGIPQPSFSDYIRGKIKNLDKIAPKRRDILYELTGLECFKYESLKTEILESKKIPKKLPFRYRGSIGKALLDIVRQGKEGIDRIVEQAASELTGKERMEVGLLKSQRYSPTPEQRVDAIMELLEILSEEVDYFRAASDKEKKVLVERLQKEPESFSYVTQILNIIYSGKQLDSWMLLSQPPSKIKKLMKKDR